MILLVVFELLFKVDEILINSGEITSETIDEELFSGMHDIGNFTVDIGVFVFVVSLLAM